MQKRALVLGDGVTLAVITFIGFASHGEFAVSFVPRLAAVLGPLAVGWFLLAPSLGLYRDEATFAARELWRPAFVMLFVGPLAAVLRGLLLNADVVPVFAVVLSVTGALGMTFWRALWYWRGKARGGSGWGL